MIHGSAEPIKFSAPDAAPVWPDPTWFLAGPAYALDRCIHEIIQDQVKRTPDADAVVFEQERLSYRELNRSRINWRIIYSILGYIPRCRSHSSRCDPWSWQSRCWRC